MDLFRTISKLRYVSAIAVVCSFAGSALMFVIGGLKVLKAMTYFMTGKQPSWVPEHSLPGDTATILILASLDSFLIALALLYFGYGTYALVIDPEAPGKSKTPKWLVPKGIKDLKETLAQVIVIVLFVFFLDQVWTHHYKMEWELLVMPVSIALLALALKLMDFKE